MIAILLCDADDRDSQSCDLSGLRVPSPTLGLLAVVAATSFACVSTGAAEFTFGKQVLVVPDGFEIELIAGPPLVSRPISASFDEAGRLYVTESSGSSANATEQLKNPQHRILRLEDASGNGRFDRCTVFAERMMFPEGCLALDGSLYVSAVPQIWKLTDEDGDGISDKREVWLDGKTVTGCANDLHGPYQGRDGWIYWCKGAWMKQTHERAGRKPLVTRAAHIFRSRPDGTEIETVLTGGMDNPVGVAFAATGERFLSCTFYEPADGKRDGLIHAIYGGVYGKPHESLSEHKWTGDLMPGMTHSGASAPCGLICYGSRGGLGSGFSGNLFACYFNLHKVVRHELLPDGATFATRDTDFVSSSSVDFHPTDVLEDADGSLIVVDTGGWYKVCCPTSQIAKPEVLGAIYRVRKTGAPKVDDPRGLKIAWSTASAPELARLLGDERHVVSQRAIRELAKKGAEAVPALREAARPRGARRPTPQSPGTKGGATAEARVNAVWALARIDGQAAREGVRAGLGDPDATVAQAAIHAVGLGRYAGALDELEILVLGMRGPALARAAAEALGRIGAARSVPALLEAAGKLKVEGISPAGAPLAPGTRVLEHSLIYALIEIAAAAETRAGLASPNAQTRRAALVALDQMEDGGLAAGQVVPLLSSAEPVLKRTAAWIAARHPEWGEALTAHFRERLVHLPPENSLERGELAAQLSRLAKSPAIQELLSTSLQGGGASGALALQAMSGAGLKDTPIRWLDELAKMIQQADGSTGVPAGRERVPTGTEAGATLLPQALVAAGALPRPKGGHAALTAALRSVARNAAAPVQQRLQALHVETVHSAGRIALEPALFDFLIAQIAPSQPPNQRGLAAGVLGRSDLSAAHQAELVGALKQASPLDLPLILPAFARGGDEAVGLKLVVALENAAGLRSLRPETLKTLFAKYPKAVQDAGAGLAAGLAAEGARQSARLEDLARQTAQAGGDAERGKALFAGKANCVSCHIRDGSGANFGPDLTAIGKVRSERDLLEAIVFPSASFVRGYEPFTVLAQSGETFTGFLREDSPERIVIAIDAQTEKRLARFDIKRMRQDTISGMPQGFDQILTVRELADLIAFLKAVVEAPRPKQ